MSLWKCARVNDIRQCLRAEGDWLHTDVGSIVVTVLTLRPGLSNFSIYMLGLRTSFIMEDNGFKILVYNLRHG